MIPNLWLETMGAVAGALGMVGFVPQVVQTVRRGTAGDLNVWMLLIFALNTLLWAVYGLLKNALALAVSDTIILCLIGVLVFYKFRDIRRLE